MPPPLPATSLHRAFYLSTLIPILSNFLMKDLTSVEILIVYLDRFFHLLKTWTLFNGGVACYLSSSFIIFLGAEFSRLFLLNILHFVTFSLSYFVTENNINFYNSFVLRHLLSPSLPQILFLKPYVTLTVGRLIVDTWRVFFALLKCNICHKRFHISKAMRS